MAHAPIHLLRHARLRGSSSTNVYTQWHDVPEGFEPDRLVVLLEACMGSSVITPTLQTRRDVTASQPSWREAEAAEDMDDEDDDLRDVLPTTQVYSPGEIWSELAFDALSPKVRARVSLVGGVAGRVDVILSVSVVPRME